MLDTFLNQMGNILSRLKTLFKSKPKRPEEVHSQSLHVKALIALLPTEDGGRQTPIFFGYRPNHAFRFVETDLPVQFQIGEISFEGDPGIAPGERREVMIRFLDNPYLSVNFRVGTRWQLQEGAKVIGEGEILGFC